MFYTIVVTAEEDDLWSSSFTMDVSSSHDQIPANQGADVSFSHIDPASAWTSDGKPVPPSAAIEPDVNDLMEENKAVGDLENGNSNSHAEEIGVSRDDGEVKMDSKQDPWTHWPSESEGSCGTCALLLCVHESPPNAHSQEWFSHAIATLLRPEG